MAERIDIDRTCSMHDAGVMWEKRDFFKFPFLEPRLTKAKGKAQEVTFFFVRVYAKKGFSFNQGFLSAKSR